MKTSNTIETLREETRDAERLRIWKLASECKTLEELKQRLADLIESKA